MALADSKGKLEPMQRAKAGLGSHDPTGVAVQVDEHAGAERYLIRRWTVHKPQQHQDLDPTT